MHASCNCGGRLQIQIEYKYKIPVPSPATARRSRSVGRLADTISVGCGARLVGHLSDPSPLSSPSPPSPLDTLVPCLPTRPSATVAAVAATEDPDLNGGKISSLRWTVMVVRLAPRSPILRRPASAFCIWMRKIRKENVEGRREGRKEGETD